jgi:GTPase involved in cell partitioning and DNA repair
VRAKMNKNSQQAHDVTQLITKIRGAKAKTITKNADTTTISTYEKSYGSQLQNFQDIITLLKSFGNNYQPSNNAIQIEKLDTTYQEALKKTNTVTQKLTQYKPKIVTRQQGFETLTQKANAIKDMVKSQYGITSSEYILIKGLSFS